MPAEMFRRTLLLTPMLALAGCAGLDPAPCARGQSVMTEAQLLFGRNIDGKPGVSEADFAKFVDEELTPRFPEGLTVIDAAGQWRGASGQVEREGSKLVLLVVPKGAEVTAKLNAARAAYQTRFKQEAVLLISQPACVAF